MDQRRKAWDWRGSISMVLVLAVLAMLSLGLIHTVRQEYRGLQPETRPLNGWYYMAAGRRVEVTLPATVTLPAGEDALVLSNDSLTLDLAGQTISAAGAEYGLRVTLGEQTLYAYEDELFPRNAQMKAKLRCDASLPLNMAPGETLRLHFSGGNGVYRLREVYTGSGGAVFRRHVAEEAPTIWLVSVMTFLALGAAVIAAYLTRIRLKEPRLLNVAAFLLLGGLWLLTDSSLLQQAAARPATLCVASFDAFMLMGVPMIHFVRNTGEMRRYRSLRALCWLFYANAFCQCLLNFLLGVPYIDMLFVTHLLLLAGVAMLAGVMLREYRARAQAELRAILAAFALLGASGVLAMALYWLFRIPFYGVIFQVGILLFVLLLLCSLAISLATNIRFQAKAEVYQRIAKEDKLTGIGNRRAFDELLDEIEQRADQYEDVALAFLDLNGLKETNDIYGHSAGDELLIAAANCIRDAFDGEGQFFRIGGDEFCAVVCNPCGSAQSWFRRLDEEIDRYNAREDRSGGRLDIARGMSRLRDEQGRVKRISDWKYEADKRMYVDKGDKGRL